MCILVDSFICAQYHFITETYVVCIIWIIGLCWIVLTYPVLPNNFLFSCVPLMSDEDNSSQCFQLKVLFYWFWVNIIPILFLYFCFDNFCSPKDLTPLVAWCPVPTLLEVQPFWCKYVRSVWIIICNYRTLLHKWHHFTACFYFSLHASPHILSITTLRQQLFTELCQEFDSIYYKMMRVWGV